MVYGSNDKTRYIERVLLIYPVDGPVVLIV
jgi:hypothetical protein